jgi:hypothetical protein
MQLYLPEEEDANYVFYQARTVIMSIIDNPEFHNNVIGLLKATYLGPPIVIPTSFTEGEGINNESESGQEPLGLTSLVLVAVGSAALIVFVGSVYYMRRDSRDSSSFSAMEAEGNATRAAGSSFQDDTTFPFIVSPREASPRATSPFSEMLPDAYQFNENMSILSGGMSILSAGVEGLEAVLERSDEEAQSPAHTDTSSIMVSDAGYTTDAGEDDEQDISLSFDVPKSLYTKATESPDRVLLGARRRKESPVTANASILDTSFASDSEANDDEMLVWTPSKAAVFDEDDDDDHDMLQIV